MLFCQYIHHYTNKAFFTIKDMKILGNSNRGLFLMHKQLFYRICILLIILYKFQLWYFKRVPLYELLKELRKMQRRAALWITGTFWTFPTWGVEAITRLISIYFYLDKINGCHHLHVVFLSKQHIINSLLEEYHFKKTAPYYMAMVHLMSK